MTSAAIAEQNTAEIEALKTEIAQLREELWSLQGDVSLLEARTRVVETQFDHQAKKAEK